MNYETQEGRVEVDLLRKMLEIYSPSEKEAELAGFLYEQMKEMGYAVRIDDVGNLIGEIGRGPPNILFASHLDTVSEFIPVRIERGEIWGRGSVDTKGSFAAMIFAASRYVQRGGKGKILVVGFVEEEKAVKGARYFTEKPPFVDYVVSGEASGIDRITIGYKGELILQISVYTKTGHSSAPKDLFINAIEAGFSVWTKIREYTDSKTVKRSNFRSLSSTLTFMRGGNHREATKVPGECHLEVDIRIPPRYTPEVVESEINKLIEEFREENPEVKIEIETIEQEKPFKIARNTPFVNTVRDAVKEIRKKDPELINKTATGDINVIVSKWDVPAVAYGPGNSHYGHAPDERLEIKEYLDSIPVYEKILENLVILYYRTDAILEEKIKMIISEVELSPRQFTSRDILDELKDDIENYDKIMVAKSDIANLLNGFTRKKFGVPMDEETKKFLLNELIYLIFKFGGDPNESKRT